MTTDRGAILNAVLLDPEQEQLLGTLVEAARPVADREQRVFTMLVLQGTALLSGPNLGQDGLRVEKADIDLFEREGFVLVLSRGRRRTMVKFLITPEGQARHDRAQSPDDQGQEEGDSGYGAWSERRRSA